MTKQMKQTLQRAIDLYHEGKVKEGIELLAPVAEDHPVVNGYLGCLYCTVKDYDKAVEHAKRASAKSELNCRTLVNSLFSLRRFGEAVQWAERLYDITHSDDDFQLLQDIRRLARKRVRKEQ